MAYQTFRGAGQAGSVHTPHADERPAGLARFGELDAPAADSVRETLRELVEHFTRRSERVEKLS